MQTIVVNNREALVVGQMPHLGKDVSNIPQIGKTVTLIPGVNLVPSADLAVLRKNPGFDQLFKTKIARSPAPEQNPEKVGDFILETRKVRCACSAEKDAPSKSCAACKGTGSLDEVPDTLPFAAVHPGDAAELVQETFSVDLLAHWREKEGRDGVRAAIHAQIAKMNTGAAPIGAAGR